MNITSLFTAVLFIVSLGCASAASASCASPEKTTSDFYHWYLHELNQDKYPLTSLAAKDKQNLKKWVSPELLQELDKSLSENDLDAEYFTDAQDIFDDWVNNISVQKGKVVVEHQANVELTLGVTKIKRGYDITLDDSSGCWKIDHVASKQ
jgi:hypothetical protein